MEIGSMGKGSPSPVRPPNYSIKHGLYLELEKWKLDLRSALGQSITRSKEAFAAMFPNGPNAAASVLISQIIYKALRLETFQNWDYSTGEATPTAMQHYINLSNSLRKDLQVLTDMAKNQSPNQDDPDLKEYLESIKKASKAEVIKVNK